MPCEASNSACERIPCAFVVMRLSWAGQSKYSTCPQPPLSEEPFSAPPEQSLLVLSSCDGWPHFFSPLATHHLATVWNFVRSRAHLSLMKPERPYTLSHPLITTQHQCSWGESMWPRLGQSNIPPLDLELKLGHTKEWRWGECFLEVMVTLSRFQGQQGQGDKSETWLPGPSVGYTSWLLLFSDGRSIHAQLIWRYDLAAALASQPPFVSVHFLNLSLIQYPFNIYFFLKWATLILSN